MDRVPAVVSVAAPVMLLISYALRSCLRSPNQFHDTCVWNVPDGGDATSGLCQLQPFPGGWLTGCVGARPGCRRARHRVRRMVIDKGSWWTQIDHSSAAAGSGDAAYRQVNVTVAPAASVYENARPRQATWNSIGWVLLS